VSSLAIALEETKMGIHPKENDGVGRKVDVHVGAVFTHQCVRQQGVINVYFPTFSSFFGR
jgi:hypothetical protein